MGLICPYELWGRKKSLKLYNRMLKHCIIINAYGVILSKNCGVKSEWYMGFICPHELWGSKESLKLYNLMLKSCIYNLYLWGYFVLKLWD